MEFLCGSLRPIIDGKIKPDQLRLLLDAELERKEIEHHAPVYVLQKTGDALPGFGIVAAVLGIVITMASITGAVEVIGTHVAAALVGTFLGILLAYGFVGPLATNMEFICEAELDYTRCIAACVIGFAGGMAPVTAVELGRRGLSSELRPSADEMERCSSRSRTANDFIAHGQKTKHAHHGGSWKVAYADFVTAMMALFLCLWLTSQDRRSRTPSSARSAIPFPTSPRNPSASFRTRTSPPRSNSRDIFNPSPPWKWRPCAT